MMEVKFSNGSIKKKSKIVKTQVINVGTVINTGILTLISFSFLKKNALAGISIK